MHNLQFWGYLLICAGVTYLIRMVPLVLVRKKITNRFLLSFLYYIPYAVLSAMTVPAIFYATDSVPAAFVGFLAALFSAYFEKSLLFVASAASVAAFLAELCLSLLQGKT